MKAVVITDFATEPTLTDLPSPEPGPATHSRTGQSRGKTVILP